MQADCECDRRGQATRMNTAKSTRRGDSRLGSIQTKYQRGMGGSFCWERPGGGAREVWKRRLPFWQNCLKVAMCFTLIQSHGEPLRTPPLKFVTKSLVVFLLVACTVFCTVFSDGSSEAAKSEE